MEAASATQERLAAWWALPTLIVAGLTAVGIAVRVVMVQDSLFADELSTYWIVSTNGLAGVISTVHTNAEITPPLYFVVAWLTTRLDMTAELLRAPSLAAGIAAIPLTYVLGLRTVGQRAALVATAITALAPFAIFYSTEARGYELMVVLAMLSTLAMLTAVDDGRARWWIAYAGCSCAAVYTHYTAVFALGAQLMWLVWAHPGARRPALLANLAAVAAFAPWFSGLSADVNSPTTKILGELEPFTFHTIRVVLGHWVIGYPLALSTLSDLPGNLALALLVLGVAVAAFGLAPSRLRRQPWRDRLRSRLTLIVVLLLSAPVGEAVFSLFGTDVFGTRNLAVSWPAFAIALSALLVAARWPLRIAAVALVVAAYGIAGAKMIEDEFQRPNYRAVAGFIEGEAAPGDVVVDTAGFSPGPVTPLDATLNRAGHVFRVGVPKETDHPFNVFDTTQPAALVTHRAVTAAHGNRIFLVVQHIPSGVLGLPNYRPLAPAVARALPASYREVESRSYPGDIPLAVRVFARRGPAATSGDRS